MNAKNSALAVFLTVFAAVPLLAQSAEPSSTAPAAVAPAPQQDATPSKVSNESEPAHVAGTLVSIADGRIELMVQKAFGPSAESAGVLVGQTLPFILDTRTEKPAELRVGEALEVWFTEDNGLGRALRIVAAEEAGGASTNAAAVNPSGATPPDSAAPATNPPDATAQASQASGAAATAVQPPAGSPSTPAATTPPETAPPKPAAPPAAPRAVAPVRHTKALVPPAPEAAQAPVSTASGTGVTATPPSPAAVQPPPASPEPQVSTEVSEAVGATGAQPNPPAAVSQPANPFRFIGIGAVAMLAALALLYLTLRGHAVEFGLGTGKGGAL